MKLSSRQKEIVYGVVWGDGYLQPTGVKNARLRIEHSLKQKEYAEWIYKELKNLFAHAPHSLQRVHPFTKRTYEYVRLQSHSSPWFGKLRKIFYENGKKRIPNEISRFLSSPLTLAVWYMDDGYYYQKDKSAHIYLPKYSANELMRLINAIERRFAFRAKYYCRPDRRACHLTINGDDLRRFAQIIRPYMIAGMQYKIPPDPVTTASENKAEFELKIHRASAHE